MLSFLPFNSPLPCPVESLRAWYNHPGARAYAAILSTRVAESGAAVLNGMTSNYHEAKTLTKEQTDAMEDASRALLALETFREIEVLCEASSPDIITSLTLSPPP
jgi:hypothetical protein